MGVAGMKPELILSFESGFLRPLGIEDISENYLSGINDPAVNRYLVTDKSRKQTMDSQQNFVSLIKESEDAVLFGIWHGEPPSLVGTVRIHHIEHTHLTAHLGICIFDKKAWGKGLGSAAISVVTQWSFDQLGLRWIEAGTYSQNIASRNSFIKAGYEWIADISGKYLFEGEPAKINILAARNP